MADENTGVESQADNDAASQADSGANEQANQNANDSQAESGKGEGGKDETISLDEARKLRSEAKSLRTRLKEAETKLNNYDNEKLTETQKLQKDLDTFKADSEKKDSALKTLLLQNKVSSIAKEMGARSTKSISKLIDTDALEFDLEKLDVSGVEEELKRLKKEDPDLFVSGGADGGKGSNSRAGNALNMNDIIRGVAQR